MRKHVGKMLLALSFLVIFAAGCGQESEGPAEDTNEEGNEEVNEDGNEGGTDGENGEALGEVELVLSHTAAEGTPIYTTYEVFKDVVEEKSNGEIEVTVHPHGQLADDTAGVEMLQSGALDIASAGTNNMAPFTDLFLVFDLPYIFEDQDGAHQVLSGEVGEEIKADFKEEMNMELLFYLDPGSQRDLMNTEREIRVPEDIGGLPFRSAESPIEIETIEALGGVATPISWGETYSALEQGVINATLQQYHWAVTENHQEIMNYVTETGGIHAFHLAIMSGDRFDGLSEEHQQIVWEAAQEAQEFNFEESPQLVDDLRQEMVDAGVEIYEPTDEEMEQWMDAATTVWDEFEDDIPDGLIDRIVEAQQ